MVLTYLIILTIPLRPVKRLKLKMKESVLNEWTTSICISLVGRQVYKAPYFWTSFRPSFTTNRPKISTPQYVIGGSMHILSFDKSVIFFCWSWPLSTVYIWHISQLLLSPMNCSLWFKNQKILFGWLWYLDQHVRPCRDTIVLSIK